MIRVGQKLREARFAKNLTLEEISKATKIKSSFLAAIESGDYKKLPSSAYAFGFVRNYAEFLGLSKRDVLALFRREFADENAYGILPEGLTAASFPVHRLKIKDTAIIIFFVLLVVFSYIAFQYRYTIINPPLEIDSPKENEIFFSQNVVVSGKTDSNATVYINNSLVSLDQQGSFKKNLEFFEGKGTIQIIVVNRFGRKTVLDRHIEISKTL